MTAEDTVHDVHEVAPRMKGTDGRPKPHVGPGFDDYKALHAKTIGDGSDEWWAQVRSLCQLWAAIDSGPGRKGHALLVPSV
jgi:hypothetical protein